MPPQDSYPGIKKPLSPHKFTSSHDIKNKLPSGVYIYWINFPSGPSLTIPHRTAATSSGAKGVVQEVLEPLALHLHLPPDPHPHIAAATSSVVTREYRQQGKVGAPSCLGSVPPSESSHGVMVSPLLPMPSPSYPHTSYGLHVDVSILEKFVQCSAV